jgi:hypothetical protein
MRESGSMWSFSLNRVFAPIFKRSNDLKYHKIMTRALLLYVLFDIGGEPKRFWVDQFSPRYASGGATCLQFESMVFPSSRSQEVKLRASSCPIRFMTVDFGCFHIFGPLGPTKHMPPLYLVLLC